MIQLRSINRSPLARKIRRYRRPIAAALAALAVLILGSGLRPTPPVAPTLAPEASIGADEVGVPITLANASLAIAIRAGDVVDVIAIDQDGANSRVIANKVRVIDVHNDSLLLIAAPPHQASELAVATVTSGLTIAIHPRSPSTQ